MKTRPSIASGVTTRPHRRRYRSETRLARTIGSLFAASSVVVIGALSFAAPAGAIKLGSADPPTVTNVSPNQGEISGGQWVTITGTGFDSTSTVVIGQGDGADTGAIPLTNVTVDSPTEITGETSGGAVAGLWHTFVTTENGTSDHTTDDLYDYVNPVT
jgi:hypothetical protein